MGQQLQCTSHENNVFFTSECIRGEVEKTPFIEQQCRSVIHSVFVTWSRTPADHHIASSTLSSWRYQPRRVHKCCVWHRVLDTLCNLNIVSWTSPFKVCSLKSLYRFSFVIFERFESLLQKSWYDKRLRICSSSALRASVFHTVHFLGTLEGL